MPIPANSLLTSNNEPVALRDAQTLVAQLEAQLEQADFFIVNALDSSIGYEDMCKKLRMAHATLREAMAGGSRDLRTA